MPARVAVVLAFVLSLLGMARSASAQQACRGTKTLYAGKCRYAKEIAELKKRAQSQRVAEKRRQEEDARRRKDAEAKELAEAQEADEAACLLARSANTVSGWKTYLKSRSNGACLDEAIKRITELSGAPAPKPSPDTTEPGAAKESPTAALAPDSPAPDSQPPKSAESATVSPLVWVGFGIGAVGLVLGSITGGVSFSQAQELQDTCADNTCPSNRQGDVDEMLALAHVSTVSFVIAGVGATIGVVGLFLGGSDDEQAAFDLRLGPGTMAVSGAF